MSTQGNIIESAPETEELDSVWAQRCATLHCAWVQVRYHRRRQRFFDLLDKLTKSATVFLSASLLGQWLKDAQPFVASAISLVGLLALVFGYSDRKQSHKEIADMAAALVASIEQVPAGLLSADKTAAWRAEYAKLCAKAPPPLKTLTLICEHEQSCADGNPDHVTLPCLPRRFFANFVS